VIKKGDPAEKTRGKKGGIQNGGKGDVSFEGEEIGKDRNRTWALWFWGSGGKKGVKELHTEK